MYYTYINGPQSMLENKDRRNHGDSILSRRGTYSYIDLVYGMTIHTKLNNTQKNLRKIEFLYLSYERKKLQFKKNNNSIYL